MKGRVIFLFIISLSNEYYIKQIFLNIIINICFIRIQELKFYIDQSI